MAEAARRVKGARSALSEHRARVEAAAKESDFLRHAVAEARRRGLALADPAAFESIPGFGVEAQVSGRRVAVGADRLMRRNGHDGAAFAGVTE